MSKARDLSDLVAAGGTFADGVITVSEISDLTVTASELNNVTGINSSVQDQLDTKAPLASPVFTGTATIPTASITTLSLNGTSVVLGTSANNVVQLDGDAKLPAVDGSQLQNVGGVTYICKTASINFCSGDPVFWDGLTCVTGLVPKPPSGSLSSCNPCICSYYGEALYLNGMETFGCDNNCIVDVQVRGGVCSGATTNYPNQSREGWFCIRTATVSDVGVIGDWTCICCGVLCNCIRPTGGINTASYMCAITRGNRCQPLYSVKSSSGSKSFFVAPIAQYFNGNGCCNCNAEYFIEYKVCYCTTTSEVSLISIACSTPINRNSGTLCNQTDLYWTTPDGDYTIIERFGTSDCTSNTCANKVVALKIIGNDDSACFVDGTCSTVVCGPTGGFKAFMGACCTPFYRQVDTYPSDPRFYTLGFSYTSYGLDKWVIGNFHTDATCSSISCCICLQQKYFAFRPVGNDCYEITCNALCNDVLNLVCGCVEVPFQKTALCASCYLIGSPLMSCGFRSDRAWDTGNGVKVVLTSGYDTTSGSIHCQVLLYNCFCIDASNTISYLGGQSSCVIPACCGWPQNFGAFSRCFYGNPSDSTLCYHGAGDVIYRKSIPVCRASGCMTYYTAGFARPYIFGSFAATSIPPDWFAGSAVGVGFSGNGEQCCGGRPEAWLWCLGTDAACVFDATTCCYGEGWSGAYLICSFPADANLCVCSGGAGRSLFNKVIEVNPGVTYLASGTGNHIPCEAAPSPCISCYVYVVNRDASCQENSRWLYGIAQNTVTAGGTVCIATVGMMDTSCFAERYFPDSYKCLCLPLCIGQVTTSGTADLCRLYGGIAASCTLCWFGCNGIKGYRYCEPSKNRIVTQLVSYC